MYIPYLIAQAVSLCFLLAALGFVAVSIGTNYWSETIFSLSHNDVNFEKNAKKPISYEIEKVDGLWRECSAVFAVSQRLVDGTEDSYLITRGLVFEYCFNRYQNVVDQSRQLLIDSQLDLKSMESRDHGLHWWQIISMVLMCLSAFFGATATFTTPLHYPKFRGLTALLVLLAAIFCGAGVIVYSCCYDRIDIRYHHKMQAKSLITHFGWSLWCAVGACACFLAASLGFVISARMRNLREYSRVV